MNKYINQVSAKRINWIINDYKLNYKDEGGEYRGELKEHVARFGKEFKAKAVVRGLEQSTFDIEKKYQNYYCKQSGNPALDALKSSEIVEQYTNYEVFVESELFQKYVKANLLVDNFEESKYKSEKIVTNEYIKLSALVESHQEIKGNRNWIQKHIKFFRNDQDKKISAAKKHVRNIIGKEVKYQHTMDRSITAHKNYIAKFEAKNEAELKNIETLTNSLKQQQSQRNQIKQETAPKVNVPIVHVVNPAIVPVAEPSINYKIVG